MILNIVMDLTLSFTMQICNRIDGIHFMKLLMVSKESSSSLSCSAAAHVRKHRSNFHFVLLLFCGKLLGGFISLLTHSHFSHRFAIKWNWRVHVSYTPQIKFNDIMYANDRMNECDYEQKKKQHITRYTTFSNRTSSFSNHRMWWRYNAMQSIRTNIVTTVANLFRWKI